MERTSFCVIFTNRKLIHLRPSRWRGNDQTPEHEQNIRLEEVVSVGSRSAWRSSHEKAYTKKSHVHIRRVVQDIDNEILSLTYAMNYAALNGRDCEEWQVSKERHKQRVYQGRNVARANVASSIIL